MGPAYLNDVVGMDTGKHVFDVISRGYSGRMSIGFKTALDVMVENKRFGQKTGLGFYKYEVDPKGRPKRSVTADTETLIASVRKGKTTLSDQDIVERCMLPMIIEAAHCLDEGVGETPGEIDMALIMGLGLPQHVGGALKYADFLGLAKVVAACDKHAALGSLFTPTARMRELAAKGGKFYAQQF